MVQACEITKDGKPVVTQAARQVIGETSEVWTFTLDDDTTVTKTVVLKSGS